jgi:ubiquinone/menaquinone biosynthesis C-methylase UbiE
MSAGIRFACARCHAPVAARDARALVCTACGATLTKRDGVWGGASDYRPEGFAHARRDHLVALERDHFWFGPRQRLVTGRLPDAACGRVLELGCGTGRMLPTLLERASALAAVDGYPELLAEARRRAPHAVLVHGPLDALPFADAQFDLVLALDVLEHVEPDALLREARRVAAPGGAMLLTVPSGRALWSAADVAAGHRCRYGRADLACELERNGWRPFAHTHYQFALLPAMAVSRRLAGGVAGAGIERRPPAWLGRALAALNHLEVAFSRRLTLPWGSSLLMLARRGLDRCERQRDPED